MKAPYPNTAVLAAMLRADDDKAIRYVIAELKRAGGNMQSTAESLGCSERTLYNWRDANKRLAKAFKKHALGRAGAGPNATRARIEKSYAARSSRHSSAAGPTYSNTAHGLPPISPTPSP